LKTKSEYNSHLIQVSFFSKRPTGFWDRTSGFPGGYFTFPTIFANHALVEKKIVASQPASQPGI
jgi:hypothetical protein